MAVMRFCLLCTEPYCIYKEFVYSSHTRRP